MASKDITDVHVDILEHVLKHLNFLDLFRTAKSNKHLREACRCEFKRRYARKEFVLSQVEIEPQYSDETENSITIYGLKFILGFLRIFGCHAKKLRLFFLHYEQKRASYMIAYICLFCTTSLEKLTFHNLSFDIFEYFNCVLPNVQEIVIISSELSKNFQYFLSIFPDVNIVKFCGWTTFGAMDLSTGVGARPLVEFIAELGVVVLIGN